MWISQLFLWILVMASISRACDWQYGCGGGYCVQGNQSEATCTCVQCTCFDNCLSGLLCTKLVNSTECDVCSKNPCPNSNYTCTNGFKSRSCACDKGHTGEDCEFANGDVCSSYPCLNGGTCTSTSSTFSCACPSSYVGQQCQGDNPCSTIACNHGNCQSILDGTRGTCVCYETWQGALCDQTTLKRIRSETPTCYELPTNSTSLQSTFDRKMTIEKCQTLMMQNSDNTFFMVSGYDCYYGTDATVLTQVANSILCNLPCSGNWSEMCGGGAYGLQFLFTNTEDPNACSLSPTLCNADLKKGACIDEPDGHSCVCAPGWTDSNCSTPLNPCSSLGCANGAACVETLDHSTAICRCAGGFSGTFCTEIDGCYDTPCKNAGICQSIDSSGNYACTCEPYYTGVNCTIYKACYSNPCAHGDCTDVASGVYTCACFPGFTGAICADDINECAESAAENLTVCENFGTCTNTYGSYYCSCINGTSGFNCSINPDDCVIHNVTYDGVVYPNYCVARDRQGKCFDGYAMYYCTCGPHWTGEYCLEDVDECLWSPSPCQNFATCLNTPGLYRCDCIDGTYGENCEINPDDCLNATHPCNQTDPVANCTDGFASYTCQCGPDYTGEFCGMSLTIYNILQRIGGNAESEKDLVSLMEQLQSNPSMTIDMIPFIVGTLPESNRSALSWSTDDMFLWAAYEEKSLNTTADLYMWNDVVLGNCFTFNHFNNTARTYLMRQEGAHGALKAGLKVNSNEYAPWIESNAIRVFVHGNNETVFSESPRYNCMPSTEATIVTKETRYMRLGKPYGVCISSPSQVAQYYYSGNYTVDGCIHSCYQVQMQKACGCMDSRYPVPEDANLCQLKDVNCVNSIVALGDVSTWADCVCPLPCENSQFDSSFTQANFVNNPSKCNAYTAEQRLKDPACDTPHGRPDYVIVSIRVPSLTISIYKETPAMSFNTAIGNIGGLAGVICGVNLISFFEFGFLFFIKVPAFLIFRRDIN